MRLEIMKSSVRANGFTLLELMVALVVVSILLTVGLPSFSASVRQNCTITAANTLLTVLTAARSEALKRDRTVTICKRGTEEICSAADATTWDRGYLMFIDVNGNNQIEPSTEPLLRSESPLTTCATITNDEPVIRYKGLGNTKDNSTFEVKANEAASYQRNVVISPTGRPRVCKPVSFKKSGVDVFECPAA